jgi:hypothetical protein
MAFTDEEKTKLSEKHKSPYHSGYCIVCKILARLEAAENVLLEIERFNNGILTDTSEFKAWRTAAGKDK